ncbi:MAG: hypothetical protein U9Q81_16210 [Pseudomonadota bacterium]|nr:hypothetical protein [Pseudomonadota bacterium]
MTASVFEVVDRLVDAVELARVWILGQPLPLQILVGVVALAVLWVLWIVVRVILVAFRATFRGL